MPEYPDTTYHATDTVFVVNNHTLWDIDPAFEPMLQWCRDHDINPDDVLATWPIIRAEGSISHGVSVDGHLHDRTIKVDGWPAPWPTEVEVAP